MNEVAIIVEIRLSIQKFTKNGSLEKGSFRWCRPVSPERRCRQRPLL